MPAAILPIHTPALFKSAVAEASRLLRAGQVVALPTETVYGLAANAWDPEAVQRIFTIKGRPSHNPLIVHVADPDRVRACTPEWPDAAAQLARAFWPGPLTLVLPRSPRIPDLVTAGGSTVGIRWPGHPFMQAVLRECGFPLAAPSANPANALSPTTAAHVAASLGTYIPLIVDGGESNVGIESTVVDVSSGVPRILRPGILSSTDIARACGLPPEAVLSGTTAPDGPLRSPGQLTRHYAPRARLVVIDWTDDADLARHMAGQSRDPSRAWLLVHSKIPLSGRFPNVILIPDDPEAYARGLYAELHRADEQGAEWIFVQRVPSSPAWAGVADRLARAAHPVLDSVQSGEQ